MPGLRRRLAGDASCLRLRRGERESSALTTPRPAAARLCCVSRKKQDEFEGGSGAQVPLLAHLMLLRLECEERIELAKHESRTPPQRWGQQAGAGGGRGGGDPGREKAAFELEKAERERDAVDELTVLFLAHGAPGLLRWRGPKDPRSRAAAHNTRTRLRCENAPGASERGAGAPQPPRGAGAEVTDPVVLAQLTGEDWPPPELLEAARREAEQLAAELGGDAASPGAALALLRDDLGLLAEEMGEGKQAAALARRRALAAPGGEVRLAAHMLQSFSMPVVAEGLALLRAEVVRAAAEEARGLAEAAVAKAVASEGEEGGGGGKAVLAAAHCVARLWELRAEAERVAAAAEAEAEQAAAERCRRAQAARETAQGLGLVLQQLAAAAVEEPSYFYGSDEEALGAEGGWEEEERYPGPGSPRTRPHGR